MIGCSTEHFKKYQKNRICFEIWYYVMFWFNVETTTGIGFHCTGILIPIFMDFFERPVGIVQWLQ